MSKYPANAYENTGHQNDAGWFSIAAIMDPDEYIRHQNDAGWFSIAAILDGVRWCGHIHMTEADFNSIVRAPDCYTSGATATAIEHPHILAAMRSRAAIHFAA